VGWDSTISIVTHYGLHGLGIKPQWGWNFTHLSRLALGPTQPPVLWVMGLFPGGKAAVHGIDYPPSSGTKVKERVEPYLYPLWAFIACSVVTYTFTSSQPIALCVIFPSLLPSLMPQLKFISPPQFWVHSLPSATHSTHTWYNATSLNLLSHCLLKQRSARTQGWFSYIYIIIYISMMLLCFNSFVLPTRHHTPTDIHKWRQNCSQYW
jgi:hypothetical protein